MAKDRKIWKTVKSWLFSVVSGIILAVIFSQFFRIVVVNGDSMEQTLQDGQILFLRTFMINQEEIQRGDIVVAQKETLDGERIIKRVIGLPGDNLEIRNNEVFINGKMLTEDYLKEPMETENLSVAIPEGKLFVMGDNRNISGDSRWEKIGLVDMKTELEGKVLFQTSGNTR